MSWELIETANKDGRYMLLWEFGHAPFVGNWSEEEDSWDADRTIYHGCGCCSGLVFPEPTHWMELPCFPLIDFNMEDAK